LLCIDITKALRVESCEFHAVLGALHCQDKHNLEMQRMEGVEGESPWGSLNNQALRTSEEDLGEEQQDDKTVLQVLLRPPHFSLALKMDFPELCRKFR